MTYQEVLENARTCIGPFCKACPVCNGKACGNKVPGPGAKGTGTVAIQNYDAWQKICINMDTICENKPVDTTFELFGQTFKYPIFAINFAIERIYDLMNKIPGIASSANFGAVDLNIWDVVFYIVVCLALFGASGLLAEKKLSV